MKPQGKTFTFSFSLFGYLPFSVFIFGLTVLSCKTTTISESSNLLTDSYRESADDSRFKGHYIEACKQKSLGNFERAIEQFKIALMIFPKNDAAQYELGSLYKQLGNFESAKIYLKSAININPKISWYHLLYIDCLHQTANYSEAAKACQRLVKLFPTNMEYLDRLADEYLSETNFLAALKIYDEILKIFGPDEETMIKKIRVLRILKKSNEAEQILIRLINSNPAETPYYTQLAELYTENNKSEKAYEIYKKLKIQDPANPYINLSLANYYRNQRNDSAFFKELKIAFESTDLEIDEKSKILISFYNIIEDYPEYRSEGLELCKIMVRVNPNDARSHSIYADYLVREKELNDARNQYCLALQYEPGIYVIWQEVMKIDVELQEYDSLEKHSSDATEIFPYQPLALFYNGAAKIQLKKYQEGISVLLEAKEMIVADTQLLAQVYINLVDAYNALKKYKESDNAFEQAYNLDKGNVYLLNNYSYYLSVRKEKLNYALDLSSRVVEIESKNPQFLDTYAWILFQLGQYESAKVWIEKAIASDEGKSGVLLEHYGDILFKLDQVEKALSVWKKSKETGRHSEFLDKKINDKKIYE